MVWLQPAPFGLWFLAWCAQVPILWALRGDPLDPWLCLLCAAVAEAAIFSWLPPTVTLFSSLPGWLAWAIHPLFAVICGLPLALGLGIAWRLRERLGDPWMLALPAWVVCVEWATSFGTLFPWQIGSTQFQVLPVWQLASVTGVWGVSWVLVFVNSTLAEALFRRREGRAAPLGWMAGAVVGVALVAGWGQHRIQAIDAELAVAPVRRVVQLQVEHTVTERRALSTREAYFLWLDESNKLAAGDADLLVWPEGASPNPLNGTSSAFPLWDLSERADLDLLIGAGTRRRQADPELGEDEVRTFNSVYFFDRHRRQGADAIDVFGSFRELLRSGCDLEASHVHTPIEVQGLLLAGAALTGAEVDPAFAASQPDLPASEPNPTAAPCLAALRARLPQTPVDEGVDLQFAIDVAADPEAWAMLRMLTSAHDGPLAPQKWRRKNPTAYWIGAPADCVHTDCETVSVFCRDGDGCEAYPAPPHYDKMMPLPFGEYLPLADTFPWLAEVVRGPGRFRAGSEALVFDSDGTRIATPICYEGIMSRVCRRFERPDLLVNVTNDAWFGHTAASDLHGMLVASRAAELGVPVVRSAHSGTSFVVEPHGRIRDKTPLFERVNRVVEVRMGGVDTLYAAWGDWFVALCGLGLLVCSRTGARGGPRPRPDGHGGSGSWITERDPAGSSTVLTVPDGQRISTGATSRSPSASVIHGP